MHSRNTNALVSIQNGRKQIGPAHDRNSQGTRLFEFSVIDANSWGINNERRFCCCQLLRIVPNVNSGAARAQLLQLFAPNQIRPVNVVPEVEQQVAQSAHATASCSNQVNRLFAGRSQQFRDRLCSEGAHMAWACWWRKGSRLERWPPACTEPIHFPRACIRSMIFSAINSAACGVWRAFN